jgi:pimeloyl-ACP methyl ester carboxylesterase
VGVVRALASLADLYLSDALLYLPPEMVPEAQAQYVRAGRLLTSANEQIYIPRSAAMVYEFPLAEDLPVVSLIASHDLQEQRLVELEEDFAGLTGESRVVNVDAGHYIHLEQPEVVLEAIRGSLK